MKIGDSSPYRVPKTQVRASVQPAGSASVSFTHIESPATATAVPQGGVDPARFSPTFMGDLLSFQGSCGYTSPSLLGGMGSGGMSTLALNDRITFVRRVGRLNEDGTDAVPSGSSAQYVPLNANTDRVSAADAAKMIVDTYGSNGQVSLADYAKAMNVDLGSSQGTTMSAEWRTMTGGASSVSTTELTSAIQYYSDVQSGYDAKAWGATPDGSVGELNGTQAAALSATLGPNDISKSEIDLMIQKGQYSIMGGAEKHYVRSSWEANEGPVDLETGEKVALPGGALSAPEMTTEDFLKYVHSGQALNAMVRKIKDATESRLSRDF